jgi:site-specific DNA recombinase
MRCAIYARYSSDLQDVRSIADQIAAAHTHAQRQGWQIVAEFSDAAISGSSLHNRPGLLDLMVAAHAKTFDCVLTESLDRLSRDLEDIAGIHKRLGFLGIKIVTLADGEVGKIHVGIKGMIAELYLADLAQKTKRGQVGRLKAGRIPGGICYGYAMVPGEEDRGRRLIVETEAEIVRRIFAEYVAGDSGLAIAARLNTEGVKGPRGGAWSASTINGNAKRGNGIVNNRLYAGHITFNRQSFVKDPQSGKRQARPNPPSEWIEQHVPELAIVAEDVFAAAQAKRGENGTPHKLGRRVRPKHLLSGLVRCGCCGASMIVIRGDWVGCSAQRNRGTCDNTRTIKLAEIEGRILAVLQKHLLDPDVVAVAVETYREERARLAKAEARANRDLASELVAVDRKIAGVVRLAEEDAGADFKGLAQRLRDLERQKADLESRSERQKRAGDVVVLHPQAAARYKAKVESIREALSKGDTAARDAVALVRDLIDHITATPTPKGEPIELELTGNLAALVADPIRSATVMVAGAGFEPTTFRL